jgi:uncharacterized protein YodC (DUF2158 family)
MDNNKSNQQFKAGDTVKIKSGGPIMTVERKLENNYVACQWFIGEKLESGVFQNDSLIMAYER